MLTKKDVRAIAEMIRESDKAKEMRYAGSVAYRFAAWLESKNLKFKFNRYRFIDICLGR